MEIVRLDPRDLLAIKEVSRGRPPGFCMKDTVIRADGTVEEGEWGHNWIVNTGYADIWGTYFLNVTRHSTLELHLATAISPALGSTSVIGHLTELTGATGYALVSLNTGASTDFTLSTNGSPAMETCTANASKTVWTNSGAGAWTAVTYAYLTTPSAAALVAAQPFTNGRTLYPLDTLNVTFVLTVETP